MESLQIFRWWFMIGALMALAVIMIQGGVHDLMLSQERIWEIQLVELGPPIFGGGLLGGCIALILNRIKKSSSAR
ncbi:MAG: hypothetical protein QNK38_04030 [Nitrospirota bacterium]|nr:hypothetical protein [Nitrospirota bacterium]MDX2420232.1 hypothetical protein [Nitrospirota bacterium]